MDFDITPLTNGVPDTSVFTTNDTERYFSYTVWFQCLRGHVPASEAERQCRFGRQQGVAAADLDQYRLRQLQRGRADENIYVLTNSSPVPLSPGTWYIGVFNRDTGVVNYTVLAQELDVTNSLTNSVNIIHLTNGVPFNFSRAGRGADEFLLSLPSTNPDGGRHQRLRPGPLRTV